MTKDRKKRTLGASTPQAAVGQKLLLDQREANEQLVLAAIRAQELTELAEAAQARAELMAKKLQDSDRELRATAEFREQLLGIIGHDLRNPLGAISMCTQFLVIESNYDREKIAHLGAFILRSVHRMDGMIKQIFSFTRARLGGGMPLELGPTDLRPLCEHMVEELTLTAAVPIKKEFHGDTTGTWDGERLIEALSNLVANAIDHASPSTAVVVKAYSQGPDAVVEVSNQGNPIPDELLPTLFTPFHRARPGFKVRAGHIGLGLFIAHEIVRSHGGTLAAHAASGTTTFVMRLPRLPPASGR